MPRRPYTDDEKQRFALEYLKNPSLSAAGRAMGLDRWQAQRLMLFPEVQDAIAQGQAERLRALKAEGIDVIRELHMMAFADVNEIVEYRRECCRFCHGLEHKYQHTSMRMLKRAEKEFENTPEWIVGEAYEHGGIGFDPHRPPHPDCPECHGEGEGRAIVKDTRFLSPAARALFAGVKVTRDGSIEVKTHSKEKALENLGRHLSIFNDKLELVGGLAERIVAGRKRAPK